MSKSKLGVVYPASFVKEALKKPSTEKGFVPVGLLLKELNKKELLIETFYYNKTEKRVRSEPLAGLEKESVYVSNKASSKKLSQKSEVSKSIDDQETIRTESTFEFWHVMEDPANIHIKPLVYFSRNDLDLVLEGDVENLTFSGAQVDYGTGLRDFETEGVNSDNKSAYPTLKVESNLNNNKKGALIPNVALALPCPPVWEDPPKTVKNHENIEFVNKILRSIDINYDKYEKPAERSFDPVRGEEHSMVQNLASFLNKN